MGARLESTLLENRREGGSRDVHGAKAKTGRYLIGRAGEEEVQRGRWGRSEVPGCGVRGWERGEMETSGAQGGNGFG